MGSEGVCRRMRDSWKNKKKSLNKAVSTSMVGKYFKLEERKSSFTTEVRAGTATFLTMVYIIVVNATILTDSGGTCTMYDCSVPSPTTMQVNPGNLTTFHKPSSDCKFKPNIGYEKCLSKTKSDLVVATILSSLFGCLLMGLYANLPLALAPGMGTNAYFVYNLVGYHGSGSMKYQTALAVCLVEGCVFLMIAAFGLRGKLARLIPRGIRLASAAGIGLFIAFTGLQAHQGVGLIGPNSSTLVTLAACSKTKPVTGECVDSVLSSPTFWLGVVGFLIMSYTLVYNIKGSMIYGIIFVTLVSWIRGTNVAIFPNTPVGDESYKYFKKIVDLHIFENPAGTALAISFSEFNRSEVWVAMLTLLYVELFGTTSALYSMAEIGGFVDENGNFEGENSAFMIDAGSTIFGSILGTSPVTIFVESSAGMNEGGRTGLTAVVVGFYFLVSFFFAPILVSVPPWAIGPALVMVGVMMMKVVKDIDWVNPKEAIPAFVTMLLMPLTYNISYGLIGGIGLYMALHLYDSLLGLGELLKKARNRMHRAENQVSATVIADDHTADVV